MKKLIITLFLLFLSTLVYAHGYPTIEEIQMFPESFISQPVANLTGIAVAIPGSLIGGVFGVIVGPFCGGIKENGYAGLLFGGMAGYMAGQQIAWPIYGIERVVGWCFE